MGSSQKVFALLFSVLLIQSGIQAQGLKRRQQGLAHLLLGGLLTLLFSEQIGKHEEKVGVKDILQLCGHGHCQDQNALSSMLMHTRVSPLGAARTPNPLSSMRHGLGMPSLGLPSLPSLLGGIGARISGLTQGRNSRGLGKRLDLNPFTMGYGFGNALGLTGVHGVGNIMPNLGVHNALKSNMMNPLLPNMFAQSLTQGLPQGLGLGLTHGLGHGLPLGLGHGLTNGLGHGLTNGLGHGLTNGLGHGLTNGLGGLTNGLGSGLASGLGHGLTNGLGNGLTNGLGNGLNGGLGHGLSHGLGLLPGFSPLLLPSLHDGLTPSLPEGFSPGFPPELSHVLLRNLARNQDAGHQRQTQQRTPENEGPSTDFDMSEIPFPDDNEDEKKNINDRRPDVSGSSDTSEFSELQ